MNRTIRIVTPAIYAAAVFVGFLIDTKVGVGAAVVGGVLSSVVYTVTRGGGAPSRREPRQRR